MQEDDVDRLLENLEHDPESADVVSEKIQQSLQKVTAKNIFLRLANKVMVQSLNASDHKPFVKVLHNLHGITVKTTGPGAGFISFEEAITATCLKQPKSKSERDLIRNGFPLLNELYVDNYFGRNFFLQLAKPYSERTRTEGAVAFLFEIVRNVDMLVDGGVITLDDAEELFWQKCIGIVAMSCRNHTLNDNETVAKATHFLKDFEKKGGWRREPVGNLFLTAMDTFDRADEKPHHRPEKQPAKSMKAPAGNNERPSVLKETPAKSIVAVVPKEPNNNIINNSSNNINNNSRNQPVKSFAKIVTDLAVNPDDLPSLAAETQRQLNELNSKRAFIDAIGDMLSEATLKGPDVFMPFVKMLENVQSGSPKLQANLRESITVCCMRIEQFRTAAQMDAFCSSTLVLAAEFFKINIVQSSLFKFYVRRLTRREDAITTQFLFNVVSLVDLLLESGYFRPVGDEVAFWTECTDRLSKASQSKLVDPEFAKEISLLIQSMSSRGGWQRNVVPAVITMPVLAPVSIGKDQASRKASREVGRQQEREIVLLAGNVFEDEEFRALLGVIWLRGAVINRSIVRMLEPKLKLLAVPLFADAIELILENAVFEQIENEATLDAAAKLCIEFSKVDYGRGRDFGQEFRNVCLRHFSGDKEQPYGAKKVRAILEQELESSETAQEQMALSQEIGRFQNMARRKSIGCTKLVGRMFELKQLPFRFLLVFVDALLLRRSEDASECLLELFSSKAGKDFLASEVQEKGKSEWWANFFKELLDIERQASSSTRMKAVVVEILTAIAHNDSRFSASNNGDQVLTVDKQMQLLLLDVTPELLRRHHDFIALVDRVRSFVTSECQPEQADRLFKLFLAKVQQAVQRHPTANSNQLKPLPGDDEAKQRTLIPQSPSDYDSNSAALMDTNSHHRASNISNRLVQNRNSKAPPPPPPNNINNFYNKKNSNSGWR